MSFPTYNAWGISSRQLSLADRLVPSVHSDLIVGFDGLRLDPACYSSDPGVLSLADCDLLLLVADSVSDAAIISFCIAILSMYVSSLYDDDAGFRYLPIR